MTAQHTPTPDSATIRDLSHTVLGPIDDFGNQERFIHPGRAAECLICKIGLSDRLADERSASKSPKPSDPSAIAGAIERLNAACRAAHPNHITMSAYVADLRALIADHAARALRIEALEGGVREATVVLKGDRLSKGQLVKALEQVRALLGTEGRDDG